ncbi:hypothetical protein [Lignipirellula cremea]|uniref:Uncharacterized protein n=1 Tax=Lignipirellula cremea TaxID=2528010 RepID=A0A518DPK5_9BACT|nr:hypothetical protein [Lignipirellula cremea]QDU93768.1 hypothetical protein Pla8534_15510 [Lignipirellula cremea]
MSSHASSVELTFDCLPLRTVGRLDIPIDASPKYRALCERIKKAIDKHGSHNTYFLYNARCVFRLTNSEELGMLEFSFEGVALTDASDCDTQRCDLEVELTREVCPWITEPIVDWFKRTVVEAAAVEFNRYIAAGDLQAAKERIEKIQAASDDAGGYVGMFL